MNKSLERILEKKIIQGGMGAGVSNYYLAGTVSRLGHLGVVSGVALEDIMIRGLQNGDLSGEIRSALKDFPDQDTASWIVDKYFIEGGKSPNQNYKPCFFPKFEHHSDHTFTLMRKEHEKLIVAANFVEVHLAKKGHNNLVGINYLYKIQWPLLPSLYGAMLAGVDAVLIGAGFAREVPEAIKAFSQNKPSTMPLQVIGDSNCLLRFDPKDVLGYTQELNAPAFLGIVSNHLGLKALPNADGYIFEGPTAGGHNAPARSKRLTANGEPEYGPKDDINFKLLNMLLKQNAETNGFDQPYWLAGSYSGRLNEALRSGARGIQVGTPFAFCIESGIEPRLKKKVLQEIIDGGTVFTSPVASPSGFPFKVFPSAGTLSSAEVYNSRRRACNLAFLVDLYKKDDEIAIRCPAEDVDTYTLKGGDIKDTEGRVCLCNGLCSTIGLNMHDEPAIVTTGTDFSSVKTLVKRHGFDYTAKNVIDFLLE